MKKLNVSRVNYSKASMSASEVPIQKTHCVGNRFDYQSLLTQFKGNGIPRIFDCLSLLLIVKGSINPYRNLLSFKIFEV